MLTPKEGAAGDAGGSIGLVRDITLMDATMMGVGALMGGGIFVLLGLATQVAGPAVLLALFLNGLVTIPTLMVYAELGSTFHDTGGGYRWSREALGQPFGFLAGWIGFFSHAVACALYSIASASFILYIMDAAGWTQLQANPVALHGIAVGVAALFVLLNYAGVKVSIRSENTVNTAVLVAIVVFIAAGLVAVFQRMSLVEANFVPFFPGTGSGFTQIALAMGITFIAFEGYEIISQAAEEIKDPRRNIPRAIWLSMAIVWAIMLLVTFVALGVTRVPPDLAADFGWTQSWQFLGGEREHALAAAARGVLPYGAALAVGAALLLQLTALNATIYSSSRVAFAMGRDGNLPAAFGRIHPTRRTPHAAVWGAGFVVVAMALVPIQHVAVSADVMFLLLFLLVDISYIRLRRALPSHHGGFRVPLFPWLPMVGIAAQAFLAVYLWKYSHLAWYATGLWLLVGLAVFYAYVHPRERGVVSRARQAAVVRVTGTVVRKDFRILVPVSNPATAPVLARAAGAMARSLGGEVILLHAVVVPDLTPLEEGRRFVPEGMGLVLESQLAVPQGVPVQTLVRIGHSLERVVRRTAEEEGASLLLLGWRGHGRVKDWLKGSAGANLVEFPPCDVAVLRVKGDLSGGRVLVPTHGGTHAPLAIRLGTALASARDGRAVLYHLMRPGDEGEAARRTRGRALIGQSSVPGSEVELVIERGDDVVRGIVRHANDADLVVVGATTEPWWRNYLFGDKAETVSDEAPASVLMVKTQPSAKGLVGLRRRLRALRRLLTPD